MTDQLDGHSQNPFAPPEPPRQMPRLQSQREAEDQALLPQAGPVNQLRYIPYTPSPIGLSNEFSPPQAVTKKPGGFRSYPWWKKYMAIGFVVSSVSMAIGLLTADFDQAAPAPVTIAGPTDGLQTSVVPGAVTTLPPETPSSTPTTVALGNLDPATLRQIGAPQLENTILAGRSTGWTMSIPKTWFQTDAQGNDTRFVFPGSKGDVDTVGIWIEPTAPGETMETAVATLGPRAQSAIGDATLVSSEVVVTASGSLAVRIENLANNGTTRWIDFVVLNSSSMVTASFSTAGTTDPQFIAAVETILATLEQPSLPVFAGDETSTADHIKVALPATVSSPFLTTAESTPLSVPPPPTDGISYFDIGGYALTIGPEWQKVATAANEPAAWLFCCQDNVNAGSVAIKSFPSQFVDVAGSLSQLEMAIRLLDESAVILESGVIDLPDGRRLARVVAEDANQLLRYEGWYVLKEGIGTYAGVIMPVESWAEYGPQLESYLGTLTRP